MLESLTLHQETKNGREPRLVSRLIKSLGRRGVEKRVSLAGESTPLPAGYRYKNPKLLKPKEVSGLMRQVEIGKDVPDRFASERKAWAKVAGMKIVDVAVADGQGALVGFGSMIYRGEDGQLGDFVVSPDHQRRGIGRAIVRERLRIAEQMGVTTLRIPKPEATNTLHNPQGGNNSFYLELGFHETENGNLVRFAEAPPAHQAGHNNSAVSEPAK